MENDFQYEQLSPRAFEQLAVALCNNQLGMGLEVYGPGPDGGREASYDGKISWSATSNDDVWQGYTVIQAKFCEDLFSDPPKYLTWLKGHLGPELKKWMDPDSKRTAFPRYLLLITNAKLSGQDPDGTLKKLKEYLAQRLDYNYGTTGEARTLRSKGLQEIRVWHRHKLNTLVASDADVRQRFLPLLTIGDVIARIPPLPGLVAADQLAPLFVEHAQTTLLTERWIRFHDAGDNSRRSVEKVIFDIPGHELHGDRMSVLAMCFEQGNRLLSRSVWHAEQVGQSRIPRHLVITGAPGNGKTTLTKYLTQVYRAAFLKDDVTLATSETATATLTSLNGLHHVPPKVPRWPLRVDLAAMAMEMGPDEAGPSIRKYLCDQISLSAQISVQIGSLDDWFGAWPSILLLDGLDEVTHPKLRDRVATEIEALISKADDLDGDLFIVVTTRPMGYTQRLSPEHFRQIDLAYFTLDEAAEYGRHMIEQRLADDEAEYRRSALTKFEDALGGASAERLLQTPLQVLILTIIVANSGLLPANRYQLFWTYYDTVFKREAAKRTTHQTFFRDYGHEIAVVHQRVGMLLQQRCEATKELRGRLASVELQEIARDRLVEMGHPLDTAKELATTLVTIAMQRLVLLAADESGEISFDIRSLQELMAGRALASGSEEDIRHNLTTAAISPHWRNTWLFAAGYLFDGRDHERELVLGVVETCDQTDNWPSWLYPAGPGLAASILDDGLAGRRPHALQRFVQVVLRCLAGPMPDDPKALALGLSAVSADNNQRAMIRDALQVAFAGSPVQRAVAATMTSLGAFGPHIPGQPHDMRRYTDMWSFRPVSGDRVKVGTLLRAKWSEYSGGAIPPQLLFDTFADCDVLALRRTSHGELWPESTGKMFNGANIHLALQDANLVQDIQLVLEDLNPEDWAARSMVARSYWAIISRWPVAGKLRTDISVPVGQPSPKFPS